MTLASSPITSRLAANHLCHSASMSALVAAGPRRWAAMDHKVSPRRTTTAFAGDASFFGDLGLSGDHDGGGATSTGVMVSLTQRIEASGAPSARKLTAFWAEATRAGRGASRLVR